MGASYAGEMHYNILPHDHIANLRRTQSSIKHSQNLGGGFGFAGTFNRVSDDAYFRDMSNTVIGGTQTQLLNEGVLSYGGGWWSASVKGQTYQTLQDPLAPVATPYQLLPQISVTAQKSVDDSQFSAVNEYVDFRHPTLVNGRRLVLYPSITYAVLNDPGFYLKPKLGIHNTQYAMGVNNSTNTPDSTRTLPVFSLDGGLTFERELALWDDNYVQTLEPRAFYVKIPYQDQSSLPVYDTSQAGFNFAQMFTENRFYGNDRVGDANMMTVALTSRLIDNTGGIERLRVALGQRFSYETPLVNLGPPEANSKSNMLLSVGGRVTNALTFNSLVEYDPNSQHTLSYNASTGYKPEIGKVVNLGYRYTRVGDIPANDVRQADFSTQWPLFWHWYAVSRFSYSFHDRQVLEKLVGLEYNQTCWMLRLVAQEFPVANQQKSTGIFVQLELNDFIALGADPLSALRLSVPGYAKLNPPSSAKSAQGSR
jgi:LPS-assembly protein